MNMKNIIKNKQKELMQGMIALILCVALFCTAAVSGKNDGSEWKMRHGGQKYKETGTDGQVQTPLYAGILAEFRTNEMEILVDNHEIFADAAARAAEEAAHPEQGVYTFLQGPKSWAERTGMVGRMVEPVCQGQLFWQFRMRSVLYGKYLLHTHGTYLFAVGYVRICETGVWLRAVAEDRSNRLGGYEGHIAKKRL